MTDAAIHRVSADADGQCGSFIKNQWIVTGSALAMTRVVLVRSVCHCEEDRMDDAAIHRDLRDADDLALR